jgi:hypothetical protein
MDIQAITFASVIQFVAHFAIAVSDGNLTGQEITELAGQEGGMQMLFCGVMALYSKYKKRVEK